MFVIFGMKTRDKTVDEGQFHCPNEGGTRPYEHKQARRWFSLFFIPLIPLDKQGERVRCRSCGAIYGPHVLQRHPART
ncbi:MAG: hypothetical protein R3320_14945 [Nitriliruptorales bacterium]|nr:hypothetical protein [Nitriliruptorales bacterium]